MIDSIGKDFVKVLRLLTPNLRNKVIFTFNKDYQNPINVFVYQVAIPNHIRGRDLRTNLKYFLQSINFIFDSLQATYFDSK